MLRKVGMCKKIKKKTMKNTIGRLTLNFWWRRPYHLYILWYYPNVIFMGPFQGRSDWGYIGIYIPPQISLP